MLLMYIELSDAVSLEQLCSKTDLAFHCSFWKVLFILNKGKEEKKKKILEEETLTPKMVRLG